MPQVINTNVPSLNTQRHLNSSQLGMNTAMERLSSGLRINSARDDAAGLAISDRMTSQISGLNMAVRNANDGISLAQTAEGALQESTNILQRMRELAVQSANETNSVFDRVNMQKEVVQLQAELNRIADNTTFNSKTLLDGNFIAQKFQVGAFANQTIDVSINGARADQIGNQSLSTLAAATNAVTKNASYGALVSNVLGYDLTVDGSVGSKGITVDVGDSAKAIADKVNVETEFTGVSANATTKLEISGVAADGSMSFKLHGSNATGVNISALVTTGDLSALATAINNKQSETGVTAELSSDKSSIVLTSTNGDDIGIEDAVRTGATAGDNMFVVKGVAADGTKGAGQTLNHGTTDSTFVTGYIEFDAPEPYSVTEVTGGSLFADDTANASKLDKVSTIDLTTQEGANLAIAIADGAIQGISSSRADLGAIQNRFTSTIANLENVSQNLSAARSRIMDADFAQESANLARNQILQQAGISMLAQANASSQIVLSLLQ